MYLIVFGWISVKLDFDIDFVSNFSNFLDLSYFPSILILGVNIAAFLEFFNEVVILELVGIFS